MQWLRLYDELLDDPKAQQLSPAMFKHWINLLCLANKGNPRGTLPSVKAIAFRLRLSEAKATTLLNELVDRGFLDRDGETLHPHNWGERQRQSDDVAERVRKHRRNTDVTLHETPKKLSGVTETDTETDTEQRQIPPQPPVRRGETAARGSRIPDDFAVDDDMRTWATGKGFTGPEIDHHTEAFLLYWRTKAGAHARKVDWRQTWQGWLHRETPGKWPGAAPKPSANGRHPPLPQVLQPGSVPADGGLAEYKRLYGRGSAAREAG